VPESERFVTGLLASLVIARVALKAPVEAGANITLRVVLCPAAIVTGRLGATKENALDETAILLIVIEAVPELVAETVIVLLLLVPTLPKSMVEEDNDRAPVPC